MNTAIYQHILYVEEKIEEENKRLSEALLHLGFDQEKELAEIDSISEKIRSYIALADELYTRLKEPRTRVEIPNYYHLDKLSPSKNLGVFFQKLSGKLEYAYAIRQEGRLIALEK